MLTKRKDRLSLHVKIWRYIGILWMCRRHGVRLEKWQRKYVWGGMKKMPMSSMPQARAVGKTTAVILRALLLNPQKIMDLEMILIDDPDYHLHGHLGDEYMFRTMDVWRKRYEDLGYKVAKRSRRELSMCADALRPIRQRGTPVRNITVPDEMSQCRRWKEENT